MRPRVLWTAAVKKGQIDKMVDASEEDGDYERILQRHKKEKKELMGT